jgi:hypothetical protein
MMSTSSGKLTSSHARACLFLESSSSGCSRREHAVFTGRPAGLGGEQSLAGMMEELSTSRAMGSSGRSTSPSSCPRAVFSIFSSIWMRLFIASKCVFVYTLCVACILQSSCFHTQGKKVHTAASYPSRSHRAGSVGDNASTECLQRMNHTAMSRISKDVHDG